jgi:hypothetical protein
MTLALPSRIARIGAGSPQREALLQRLIQVARQGLPRMFRPDQHCFAFTRKRGPDGQVALHGTSLRYGAITVLGACHLDRDAQRAIFAGRTAAEFTAGMLEQLSDSTNLGDLALVTWAAAELSLPQMGDAIDRLRRRNAESRDAYTVEAAWVLSALVAAQRLVRVQDMLPAARDRLLAIGSLRSGIFPHWTNPHAAPWHRRHVACFADQVYPIQALARYHKVFAHGPSLTMAARCADQICRLQGRAGQWWWHYDCRTGEVIEGYPVYTVHQDSMAPMALLDLAEAGGPNHGDAIRLGLDWMDRAVEIDRCLIDDDLALIWRKVARTGPGKMVRALRAAASRLHPRLRLRGLNAVLRPTAVDYEDRPYHLGWILHTWLGSL